MQIAILDDYQNISQEMADWSSLEGRAEVRVFTDHVADQDELVSRLNPFEVLCVMRERTQLTRAVLERLPRLKLIASTGAVNAAIDTRATADLGIEVAHTGYASDPTIELTWALILALARNLVNEVESVRRGEWQQVVGLGLTGKTLAILGLGNIGSEVARIGRAFGMEVIAWSQNLTAQVAHARGATWVSQTELFQRADFLCIHTVLSRRTRGLIDAEMLALMKTSAYLINMSRGPIVVESALLSALQERRIAGAGIDAFDTEPLPSDHPFRTLSNVVATPHLGYVTRELYRTFYQDSLRNITKWLDERESIL